MGLANEQQVMDALRVLSTWYSGGTAERLQGLCIGIYDEGPTHEELQAMLTTCKREWQSRFFPNISSLLRWMRPPKVDGPDGGKAYDAITGLEAERSTHLAWARRFAEQGNEAAARLAALQAEKCERMINGRLDARGLPPRYVNCAELFPSGDPVPASASQGGFQDWTREADD